MALTSIVRPEYPRPQWVREQWLNLNGPWEFEIDNGRSGRERKLNTSSGLSGGFIVVPFCPESELSGVGHKDFMQAVWYRREFTIPESWRGNRVLVHFGAVDYACEVWVNGVSVGTHQGGYASFSLEITKQLRDGSNVLTVCAEDDVRSGRQPKGKQSSLFYSHGCDYTRTTGIWQTVWLECVPSVYIESMKVFPDAENSCVHLDVEIRGDMAKDMDLRATSSYEGTAMGEAEVRVNTSVTRITMKLSEVHLWEPGRGRLYDLSLRLEAKGETIDVVESYFGLRTIALGRDAVYLNGKAVFQRLVLDQGYYPEGVYTAPTDDALRRDIEIAMELGFNGARLHQKVFEPRFLYWADRMGYLVWGEHASWGLDISTAAGIARFLPEWTEVVGRDFNHPAIIGWCPFNETWDDGHNGARQEDDVLRVVYQVTKRLDPTRPVIDTSGNFHVVTDIFDVHDYEQDVKVFADHYAAMTTGKRVYVTFPERQRYEGQPYFVSEYGGIWWNPSQAGEEGWGYGQRPTSEKEFLERYQGLTETLLQNPAISGFCYTQLYDVEQEVNGLCSYHRVPKFPPELIRRINTQRAAIES